MVRRANFEVTSDEVVEELAFATIDRANEIQENSDSKRDPVEIELRTIGRRLLESTRE